MDIITCHLNADFDCLSSMVGVKKLFPDALLVFPGSQEKALRDFLRTFPLEVTRIKDVDPLSVTRLIVVDTRDPDRIGSLKDVAARKDVQVFVYDHHPKRPGQLRSTVEVVEEVGATATIITEILKEHNVPLTTLEATLLCLGIYEETGSMRFPTTTERDLLAAAFLLRRGANLNIVAGYIKPELSREGLEILNEIVASLTETVVHGLRIKTGTATRDYYIGDMAQYAHSIMDMEDMDALVLILNMEGKVVLIGRSRAPECDMAALMRLFGGDGHAAAASASVKEEPLDVIKEKVHHALETTVRPTRIAKDIMTSPVVCVPASATVREAEALLTRYEINVLPVLQKDAYLGLVSREVVEKALFHGFKASKVIEFTTTDALTATVDTPLREIEKFMIEQNQRFVPVLEEDRVAGAITRTDLLRSLYEDYIRKSRLDHTLTETKSPMGRNIASLLKERFPNFIVELLLTCGSVADAMKMNVFLVGGSVRDLLRGERNLDLDIVVEGDGIRFAERLSAALGARLTTHRRFHTAKVTGITLPAGFNAFQGRDFSIDIATSRTEYYEKPAELPRVETSSIKKDLYRRDFTINALATKLNKKDFGLLIDFYGGQRDLKEGVIRVLHNLSFIEDPTRAFRAVRFSERFGFKVSAHTEKLIRSALKFDLFERLSGSRLYDELALIFRETEPAKALKRLSTYGLLQVIHPDLQYTVTIEALLRKAGDTLSWHRLLFLDNNADPGILYLTVLLSSLAMASATAALERLNAPPTVRDDILLALGEATTLAHRLDSSDPALVYRSLKRLPTEAVLFLMALCTNQDRQKAVSTYLREHIDIKPRINGKDLIHLGIPPGPIYSEILNRVLDEILRGTVNSRNEELAFVKRYCNER